ncbi:MAG: hypothetical protein J7J86_07850 [Bacteroidales bacterium]|nr:hypothetical protein [Bacteroidales bacterium]
MNKNTITPRFIFVVTTIIIASLMRLIPHWPNFTPIAAIALFGGTYLSKKYLSFLIPFAALFLSDLILGFHSSMIAVYLSFGITVLIGFYLKKNLKAGNIIAASLISSVIFFVITNFSAWLVMPMYPKNFLGLMEAYTAGLAFFNNGSYGISFFLNSVLGGLAYNILFFGVFYLAKLKFPVLAKA